MNIKIKDTKLCIPEHPARVAVNLFQQHDVVRLADFHWDWQSHQHHVQADTKQSRSDPAWPHV